MRNEVAKWIKHCTRNATKEMDCQRMDEAKKCYILPAEYEGDYVLNKLVDRAAVTYLY